MVKTLSEKVEEVLDEVRPSLALHGGNAKVLEIKDGIVHLALEGKCKGCPLSGLTFGTGLKDMLCERFSDEIKDVTWN